MDVAIELDDSSAGGESTGEVGEAMVDSGVIGDVAVSGSSSRESVAQLLSVVLALEKGMLVRPLGMIGFDGGDQVVENGFRIEPKDVR